MGVFKIITPSTGLRDKIDWENQKDRIYYVANNEKHLYEDRGLTVVEMPDNLCRSQARRFIVENETEPFFMIDDDIPYFILWQNKDKPESRKISVYEACQLLLEKIIEFNLQDRALIDFGNKAYSRLECKRGINFMNCLGAYKAYYINPQILKKLNINFPNFDCQEDLELGLQLWEAGNYTKKFTLIIPYYLFYKDEDSVTWKNNKRTKASCDIYLRWGNIIKLFPDNNTKKKVIRCGCPVRVIKKIIKNEGYNWDKTPDPVIKKLIEDEKYEELYDMLVGK
jgi:hypothetical protein